MFDAVLNAYGLAGAAVEPLGGGLINHTWKVTANHRHYVLQRLNQNVFRRPSDIAFNVKLIGDYLQERHPGYFFARPLLSAEGREMICVHGAYYRLFPFVAGSHAVNVASTPQQAYEAAAQFGKFTRLLAGFDAARLKITLPNFHNLVLRYEQFLQATKTGNGQRIREAKSLIAFLAGREGLVKKYIRLQTNKAFKLRVTHHDTKISNVLFDENDKGLCVIDLDTVMPGYFISDVGDMMRTYLSPVSEEENDLGKIEVREELYKAVVQGYGDAMNGELTKEERSHFFYAGQFMAYMQALRFLTDYLNNDVYYGARYEEHNLARAKNQAALLERLTEKRSVLEKSVAL